MTFNHNPELALAETIPSDWYTSTDFFGSDCEKIFDRSWNLAGSAASLRQKGDYLTHKAGRENILVVNTGENLKSFVNVCRHRAGPVALGSGNTRALQCRYHGWTYSLEGELVGTPEFQGVLNFEKEKCSLPKVEVSKLASLIFTSLAPAIDFQTFIGDLGEKLGKILSDDLILFLEKDYPVKCNWKVYVDNYLEGYHIPMVHKGLLAELDYSRYETITSQWYSEQKAPSKEKAAMYRTDRGDGAHYYWLFPNTMLNIYQGLVQTNVVIPVSPSECVVRFAWYTKPNTLEIHKSQVDEMIGFSDIVQEEDRLICERVQENLLSKTYAQGRYSVKRENGVHHFHQLLAKKYSQKPI